MRRTLSTLFVVALLGIPASAAAQDDHDDHDHAAAGQARHLGHHATGFPEYVDVFFTAHAYLERKLHPRFESMRADGLDTWTASGELAWRFTDRIGGEVAVAFVGTDPEIGDGATGIGDIELAPMVALLQDPGSQMIVSARSGFVIPTGDEEEGLGAPGWGWQPSLLAWKGFGPDRRGALQAEVGYDRLFADEGEDAEAVVYNLAASWWLPSNVIPVVELNGVTPIGETDEERGHDDPEHEEGEEHASLAPARGPLAPAHGETVVGAETTIAGTVGFRYAFANGQQWGAGLQVPLSGSEIYDVRLVVGGIIHLP